MMHRKSARIAMISGYKPKISICPESSVEMKERLSISTLPIPCSISPIRCVPSLATVIANDQINENRRESFDSRLFNLQWWR